MLRRFVPFQQLRKQPTIVVDSVGLGASLTLAHWRGAATPELLRDDTSAGSVLRALRAPDAAGLTASAVTANHFDVDGFVGVWSLLHPEAALRHEHLLRLVAILGDFRELDWQDPLADHALRLVCWLNAREKELFYVPFGAPALRRREDEASTEKFRWFLPRFLEILENPEVDRVAWEPEYERVLRATNALPSASGAFTRYPEIGLVVVRASDPLPYYALFGATAGYDMVLSLYDGQRYEFEYKYTTWIDLESRVTLPRLPLDSLAAQLNAVEQAPYRWTFDGITDTGPLLRLAGKSLNKAQRYADPDQRPIQASSLLPQEVEQLIVSFFQEKYATIQAKRYWTWAEIRAAGQ
ncbi:hypothetical protein MTX78_06605 [Hymenobacter tibetensis]|uniref:Uncharacterized protein n=1 Tax=Hymenobacter tibetensis TaxID=497967 RepID=A0ABY4D152_9BACT|nr:DUF6687 family protein [Hymenobacter tibetensis]UOG76264.1 hypothetical protein MTX78_06605 [Hymenobacter tibetensis]